MLRNINFRKKSFNDFLKIILIGLIFLILFSLFLSRAMNAEFDHDEGFFVAAGQILANKNLLPYKDYPFLHLPYLIGLYALLFKFTSYDLLTARIVSALCGTLSAALLFYVAYRYQNKQHSISNLWIGILVVILFVTNSLVGKVHSSTTNYAVPSLLSLLGFFVYLKGSRSRNPFFYYLICGVLVGLATGFRITYFVLVIPFSCAVLLSSQQQTLNDRIRNVVTFGLGVFLALIPVAILFTIAPKQFIYGNYLIIKINTAWRHSINSSAAMTIPEKLDYFFQDILVENPINLLIYSISIFIASVALSVYAKTKDQIYFDILVLFTLSIFLTFTAFGASPTFKQYFFAPIPFLLLVISFGFKVFQKNHALQNILISVLLIIFTIVNGSIIRIGKDFWGISNPEKWIPVRAHNLGENLRTLVSDGKVLTLTPFLPLEGSLDIYEIFTIGPFSWRNSHLLSDEKRKEYDVIAYMDLEEYLIDEPPHAILVGGESKQRFSQEENSEIELPLINYAIHHGFTPIEIPSRFAERRFITLWVK